MSLLSFTILNSLDETTPMSFKTLRRVFLGRQERNK